MPKTTHIFLDDAALTEQLAVVAASQRRSQKAVVIIALEAYFAQLDQAMAEDAAA